MGFARLWRPGSGVEPSRHPAVADASSCARDLLVALGSAALLPILPLASQADGGSCDRGRRHRR